MVARRSCTFVMPDGRACRAGPQRDRPYCFAHDPERAQEAAEARRLGGLRRGPFRSSGLVGGDPVQLGHQDLDPAGALLVGEADAVEDGLDDAA